MDNKEKLSILAEILEVEESELSTDSILEDFETWDSVAVLSIIAVLDEKFNKIVHASKLRDCNKISDIMQIME